MFSRIKESFILDEIQSKEEVASIVRLTSHKMAIPLFLLFWVADLIYYPEFKYEFLFLRLSIIPMCLIINYFLKLNLNFNKTQLVAVFYLLYLSTIINTMILISQHFGTPYYAGLNLVSLVALSFVPFQFIYWLTTFIGIYLPYFLISILQKEPENNVSSLVLNSFFIIATVIMCLIIRMFYNRLRNSEFKAQKDLQSELSSREEIIQKKSEEATQLHRLSSQFSPQVIQAIRKGDISLDSSLKSAEICVIFIDIVNSTDKVNKLSQFSLRAALTRFLETTITTFLKYDLTIDKFQGDGVLAFSNMPIERSDFVFRTCLAALETLQLIKKDKQYYEKIWGSELNIKIGISKGKAQVGFLGDEKYFKSYTAIGSVMSYAHRLASVAIANEILVDKSIGLELLENGYRLSNKGVKSLKGYENDRQEVYSLLQAPDTQVKSTKIKSHQTCPIHIKTVMYLDTNKLGHYVFKCRECEINGELPTAPAEPLNENPLQTQVKSETFAEVKPAVETKDVVDNINTTEEKESKLNRQAS